MSSESPDPTTNPICFEDDSLISNADMDGIAVAVANVIVNLCLRIMVTWSPGDVDVGIQSLLIQIYPILLSTLFSINRQQLSTSDASFALLVSSSPLTVYLVVASICDLCGIRTGLYKRIKSYRLITRILGALVLLLWTGLSMATTISARAFKDSLCYPGTFKYWLLSIVYFILFSLVTPGVVTVFSWVIIFPLFVCLARRWSQIRADVKLCSEGASRFRVPWTWMKCTWCTIDRNHKWFIYYFFTYLDIGWGIQVIVTAINLSWEDGYVLSYGQLVSALFAGPTLISTGYLIYLHRLDLLHLLRRLPRLCLAEARFLLTGKELNPTVQDSHLPFNITSYPEKPILGKSRDQIVTSVRSNHQPPLLPELDRAMWSGWGQDTRFCISCVTPVNAVCDKV